MSDNIPPSVHLVGIGGMHMSAIGRILLSRGHRVSGSDLRRSPLTDALAALGARVAIGPHDAANLPADAGLVVTTSAAIGENPELDEARRRGLPVIKRAEMVARLMQGKTGVAVAGCHGKSTTSGLIAYVLRETGRDPTYLIGAEVAALATNAAAGEGPHVVVEADEYDRAFLSYNPRVAVVTNVEPDHLDYYKTWDALKEAFAQFAAHVEPGGTLILCAGNAEALALARHAQPNVHLVTYSIAKADANRSLVRPEPARPEPGRRVEGPPTSPRSSTDVNNASPEKLRDSSRRVVDTPDASTAFEAPDWLATNVSVTPESQTFTARHHAEDFGAFTIALPGAHNVQNALGAVAALHALGLTADEIAPALARYTGVRRRFERIGEAAGVLVMDDYAHHPTEVEALARAARQRFPGRRIVVCFQPHTYARTRYLLDGWRVCFQGFDRLFLLETYAAREAIADGMTAADLVPLVTAPTPTYAATFEEAAALAAADLRAGDVFFTVGAGDVDSVGLMVLERLRAREAANAR